MIRGVARIFQRRGHTVSKWGYSPDCHYGQGIVMAFSPPVVGLQKGGSREPQDPPRLRPWWWSDIQLLQAFQIKKKPGCYYLVSWRYYVDMACFQFLMHSFIFHKIKLFFFFTLLSLSSEQDYPRCRFDVSWSPANSVFTKPNSCMTRSSCRKSSWPFKTNMNSAPLLPIGESKDKKIKTCSFWWHEWDILAPLCTYTGWTGAYGEF